MVTRVITEQERKHYAALASPRTAFECSLRDMIRGWREYADAHKEAYDTELSEDYVLGEDWRVMGQSLLGLLNGELGRYDGGTLDALIRETFRSNGFSSEGEV